MAEVRLGVVGVPGGWSTEALADAVAERTGHRIVVDPGRVDFDSERGAFVCDGLDLLSLDGMIIKKIGSSYGPTMLDRLEVLEYVQKSGVPSFSRPDRIRAMVNRVSCTLRLQAAGLPLPPTILTEDSKTAADAVRRFGSAVLKPIYSTKGEGIRLVSDGPGLEGEIADHGRTNELFYVQKKLELQGKDFGVVFLGGEYLGTYARVAGEGSWQTTIRSGGHYAPYDASPEIVELGRRAQALFGLDFTSVDIAITTAGPVLFEVSAFGGYRGVKEGLGIDAPARVSDYVIERLRGERGG